MLVVSTHSRCQSRSERGDPSGQELASAARSLARVLGLDRLERSASIVVARAALEALDDKAAEQLLDNVRRRTEPSADPFAAMQAALYSALAKRLRAEQSSSSSGRERLLKTGLKRAEEAFALGKARGYATGQILGIAAAAEIKIALGDLDDALLFAQRATKLFEERGSTGLPVEVVLGAHARALVAQGDEEEARAVLERAIAELERGAARLPKALRSRYWIVPGRAALKEELS